MPMSKKVYVSAAETLAHMHLVIHQGKSRADQKNLAHVVVDRVTTDLSRMFAEDNPAFNAETFAKSAGLGAR